VDAEEAFTEKVREQFPDWEAAPADPMTQVRDSVAVLYADTVSMATRAGEELFRYFGRGLAGLPPSDERPAFGQVTITAQDAAGPYVVPEGLELEARGPLGEPVGFRTLAAGVIPNGATTGTFDVEALEEGVQANGISGPAEFSEYVDYLTDVAFVGVTDGGQDAEGDTPYLDRLQDELAISTPRPVKPDHFAVLARRLGAYRATVIDGLDPVAGTTGNAATVTIAMVDEAGQPLSAPTRTAIGDTIKAMREVGWAVFAIDADYTSIDVAYTATAYPGEDPVATKAAADATLLDFLSPSSYGSREETGVGREWFNRPLVRYLEVAERLQRVESLDTVDTLTIAKSGDPLATADVVMTGYAPLPTAGAITGTVAAG
jgi:hypothetical protein